MVAAEAVARGFRRLGLTGTRWLVESDVYPGRLSAYGLDWVRPSPADRDAVHRIIMDELVYGDCRPEAVAALRGIVGRMQAAGCDAVVLACTELPLLIDDENLPLPTLNSTRVLARAALLRAVAGT